MSTLDANQQEIAEILFNLPDATGFALAGGAALLAHGTIDRPTRDLDAFIGARPETPHGDVTPLLRSFETALTTAGWEPSIIREHNTFARLLATTATITVEIDLAVDSPRLFPTQTINGLPMLAQQDLAARPLDRGGSGNRGRLFQDGPWISIGIVDAQVGRLDAGMVEAE